MRKFLLPLSLLLTTALYGTTPKGADHDASATGQHETEDDRAIDGVGVKSPTEKGSRFIPCNEKEEITSHTPNVMNPNRLVRALVVMLGANKWKLATLKDADENLVQCATILTDESGLAIGRYSPKFKSHFKCDSEPFVSSVPGHLIFPNSPSWHEIKYFPIHPPGAPENSQVFEWVPAPCGGQEVSSLLAMVTNGGDETFAASGETADPEGNGLETSDSRAIALKILEAQALTSGPYGEASRLCLAKYEAKLSRDSADESKIPPVVPQPLVEIEKSPATLPKPLSQTPANSGGDRPAPPEFFDD